MKKKILSLAVCAFAAILIVTAFIPSAQAAANGSTCGASSSGSIVSLQQNSDCQSNQNVSTSQKCSSNVQNCSGNTVKILSQKVNTNTSCAKGLATTPSANTCSAGSKTTNTSKACPTTVSGSKNTSSTCPSTVSASKNTGSTCPSTVSGSKNTGNTCTSKNVCINGQYYKVNCSYGDFSKVISVNGKCYKFTCVNGKCYLAACPSDDSSSDSTCPSGNCEQDNDSDSGSNSGNTSGDSSGNSGSDNEDSASSLSALEQQMVSLVNAERTKAGVEPLKVNLELTKMARDKSQDMIDNNYFSHTSPTYGSPFDMMAKYGITYRAAGENIAMNSSVTAAHTALMNSQGHRENILNSSYTQIGIGIEQDSNGYYYISQEFIG